MAKREASSSNAPTRKQILLSRREREQLRLVYIGLGLVAALIVIVLGIGAIQTFVIEPNAPIATVDGVEIITRAYQNRVKYERFLLDEQFQQLLTQRENAVASGDEQLAQFFVGQYDQLLNQLLQQRSILDQQTVDQMIDEVLIAKEAEARGITVSDEEINEAINRFLAARQGGLTAESAAETATARVEASATAALWTPTPTFTPSPTLTTTEQITPTATPVDTPTPAPTPTLNVIDDTALSTEYSNWLQTLAENTGVDELTYRNIIQNSLLTDKVQEALGTEVPTSAEQVKARHILVETEEEAQDVIKRLNAGEDFADLASELSIDPGSAANGGDLDFVPQGTFLGPFDEAVFSLPIGEISEPVETQAGWHVIEVLAREVQELSPSAYQRSQQQAFDQWLMDKQSAAEVVNNWTFDKAPDDPNNPLQQSLPQAPVGSSGG